MKKLFSFLKTTLLGGVLVVAPIWALILILLKGIGAAEQAVQPIAAALPAQFMAPQALAAILLLTICFVTGFLVRTAIGRHLQGAVERHLLERVPGYSTLRNVSENLAGIDRNRGFQVALVEMEDGLIVALVVERHADGRCTIFVPAAPTPFSGSIFIVPSVRVHVCNISLAKGIQCISRYGVGSSELLAALRPAASETTSALNGDAANSTLEVAAEQAIGGQR
jgi:uncharacterized membrane protein